MSNALIRAELGGRLETWAQAQSPPIPLAFEEVPFTKPTTGTFMEAYLIPNITFEPDVAAKRHRLLGIFQVNCWARSGKGMKTVEQLAQSVVELFPVLPKTGSVSIEQTPNAEKSIRDDSGWVVVPVTIMYRYEIKD